MKLPPPESTKIAIVGLGYVGLPLAVAFGRRFKTLGFDIDAQRISELEAGIDRTGEVTSDELDSAVRLTYSRKNDELRDRDVFIVAVPTPVDRDKRPDFTPLVEASRTIGSVLARGNLVIFESTVYPGATEEVCVPELERASGLRFNVDFTVGYSPERISPGDKNRRLADIPKVTSGSTDAAAALVDSLYGEIVSAGTHRAPSIKVAEASKVVENTQRDVNIALMNEFALIFQRLGIDTHAVLAAAATKWNFLPFRPGLVGGHCIGVDPYYLIQKAQSVGYFPDVLIASRRINDAMGRHVAAEVVKLLIQRELPVRGARILVLGLAFKEDCSDLRNTRVVELAEELESFGAAVSIYDPRADADEAKRQYGIELVSIVSAGDGYDALVVAVAHQEFRALGARKISSWGRPGAVLYDIKGIFARDEVDGRL